MCTNKTDVHTCPLCHTHTPTLSQLPPPRRLKKASTLSPRRRAGALNVGFGAKTRKSGKLIAPLPLFRCLLSSAATLLVNLSTQAGAAGTRWLAEGRALPAAELLIEALWRVCARTRRCLNTFAAIFTGQTEIRGGSLLAKRNQRGLIRSCRGHLPPLSSRILYKSWWTTRLKLNARARPALREQQHAAFR